MSIDVFHYFSLFFHILSKVFDIVRSWIMIKWRYSLFFWLNLVSADDHRRVPDNVDGDYELDIVRAGAAREERMDNGDKMASGKWRLNKIDIAFKAKGDATRGSGYNGIQNTIIKLQKVSDWISKVLGRASDSIGPSSCSHTVFYYCTSSFCKGHSEKSQRTLKKSKKPKP